MNNTLKVTFALIFSLTFFSCSEDNKLRPTETTTLDESTMDKDFRGLALMLSKKIQDEDVVSYIYQKASERFDGDYDILLAKDFSNEYDAKTRKKGSYVNLKTVLAGRTNRQKSNLKSNDSILNDLDSYFDDLLKAYPTLQLSVPNYSEKPKTYYAKGASSNKSPLVAYYTNSSNESTITAFDENGREYILTNEEVPDRPVILISNSERVIALESDDSLYYYRYACPEVLEIAEPRYTQLTYYRLYNCDDIYSGGGGGGNTTTTPHRDYNNKNDNLYKARFNSMRDKREYESWWLGDAEVMVKVFFAKNNSGVGELDSTTKHINGGFVKTKWWGESFTKDNVVNIPIVNWDKDIYGDRMKYVFYEIDGWWFDTDVTVTHTTKIGGTSITAKATFKISGTDDHMGDFIVDYSTNTKGKGTKFSTGSFHCWINQ